MKKLISVVILLITLVIAGCDFDSIKDSRYGKAKKRILTVLNDPDSYEMEYYKTGNSYRGIYKIKFRAKNGFGAKVIHYAYVYFSDKGNIEHIDFRDSEDKFIDQMLE